MSASAYVWAATNAGLDLIAAHYYNSGLAAQVTVWPKPESLVYLLYVIKSPQSSVILPADHFLRAVSLLDFLSMLLCLPRLCILFCTAFFASGLLFDDVELCRPFVF